ncbi:hypothetical protein EIP86_006430 [Pleurotus ostreatoroseus]|nr:hypothetical protein EIP86_006430 [Pleurotus ostreatoroseus]
MFGTYLPPPTSLSGSVNIPTANRSTRVPEEVLTDAVIEELKTRCCFVGDALDSDAGNSTFVAHDDNGADLGPPPSDITSESEFTRVSKDVDMESNFSSQQAASSGFSVVSHSHVAPSIGRSGPPEKHLQALASLYTRYSTATDLRIRVEPPPSQQTGTGRGTLLVPGWVRERAAEVLFEGGDVDESSVAEVILDSLLKVPVDLRKTLASSILVVGGTPMLPGFIPRLHAEIIRAISPPSMSQDSSRPPSRPGRPRPSPYGRYSALRPLVPYIAILNNPTPPPPASTRASENAGKAPAFTPATMAWVGGSLAGALKTGGAEVAREKWDEADSQLDPDEDMLFAPQTPRPTQNILPDWTRSPLPIGAPSAKIAQAVTGMGSVISSPVVAVNA